jgi:predicted AAA+ superfamily ATPase
VSPPDHAYRHRLVDGVLDDAMQAFGAVMVTGPRAVGKTTSAARVAVQVDRLDVPDVAAVYRADPDAALRRAGRPLLIDEWQHVPEVLGAVKRAVDTDRTPGQFILTGSVSAETDISTWAGTGRVVRIDMWPLTEREVETGDVSGPGLIERLTSTWLDDVTPGGGGIDDAVARALRGGFPELAYRQRTARQRSLWLSSYLDDLVTHDVASTGTARDPERLRRYVAALAEHLAGQPADATLWRDADINARTAAGYDRVLVALGLLDLVTPWNTSRIKRLTKGPKRYLTDTAIAAAAARIGERDLFSDPDLLGRWIDAFVTMQIRGELAAMPTRPRLHHLRVEGGRHEIDLVVDLGGRRLFGIEIKAGGAPGLDDARHLLWLRDELGERFAGGIVLHAGAGVAELGDRIAAVPISAAWS